MSNVLVNEEYLSAIANAIRAKNGSGDTYTPGQMAAAIGDISGGGASDNDCYWLVDYRDAYGNNLSQEYVQDGDPCTYSYKSNTWSTTQGGTADSSIRNAVTSNLTLFYAPNYDNSDLVASSGNTIIACGNVSNFVNGDWHSGEAGITLSQSNLVPVFYISGVSGIFIPAPSEFTGAGNDVYIDAGVDSTSPATFYAVVRATGLRSGASNARLFGAFAANNAASGLAIVGSTGTNIAITEYSGNYTSAGAFGSEYVVCAIKRPGDGTLKGYVYKPSGIVSYSNQYSNILTYVSLGRDRIGNTQDSYSVFARFFGATNVAEDESTISDNLENLYQKYVSGIGNQYNKYLTSTTHSSSSGPSGTRGTLSSSYYQVENVANGYLMLEYDHPIDICFITFKSSAINNSRWTMYIDVFDVNQNQWVNVFDSGGDISGTFSALIPLNEMITSNAIRWRTDTTKVYPYNIRFDTFVAYSLV